jgi:hypothetical protein
MNLGHKYQSYKGFMSCGVNMKITYGWEGLVVANARTPWGMHVEAQAKLWDMIRK